MIDQSASEFLEFYLIVFRALILYSFYLAGQPPPGSDEVIEIEEDVTV